METEQGYNAAELLTADGCGPTKIVIADKDSGEQLEWKRVILSSAIIKTATVRMRTAIPLPEP